jgi:hypothetical protein
MATAPTTPAWLTKLETFASELETLAPTGAALIKEVISAVTGVSIPSASSGSPAGTAGASAGASGSVGLNVSTDPLPEATAGLNLASAVVKLNTQLDAEMNTPAMLTAAEKQAVQDHLDSMNKALQSGDESSVRLMLAALQTK